MFKFGLPFFTFMIAAPFGLKQFQEFRFSEKDKKRRFLSTEEEFQVDLRKVTKFDIEEELRKTKEKWNINQ